MTFKPGMHQIVETRQVDFDAIIAKMAGVQPQTTLPSRGWGKKVYLKATLKRKDGTLVEVQFFSELVFPGCPANREVGYTRDDADNFTGVQILDYSHQEPDDDGVRKSQGEIMAYEDFVDRYLTRDSASHVSLSRMMEGMAEKVQVSEKSLERINSAWENRDPGSPHLYKATLQ